MTDEKAVALLSGGQWKNMTTDDYFKGKKVVLFSLQSCIYTYLFSQQLPGFDEEYNQIKLLAVDEVYCVSVNDAYVMNVGANIWELENVKMI